MRISVYDVANGMHVVYISSDGRWFSASVWLRSVMRLTRRLLHHSFRCHCGGCRWMFRLDDTLIPLPIASTPPNWQLESGLTVTMATTASISIRRNSNQKINPIRWQIHAEKSKMFSVRPNCPLHPTTAHSLDEWIKLSFFSLNWLWRQIFGMVGCLRLYFWL